MFNWILEMIMNRLTEFTFWGTLKLSWSFDLKLSPSDTFFYDFGYFKTFPKVEPESVVLPPSLPVSPHFSGFTRTSQYSSIHHQATRTTSRKYQRNCFYLPAQLLMNPDFHRELKLAQVHFAFCKLAQKFNQRCYKGSPTKTYHHQDNFL